MNALSTDLAKYQDRMAEYEAFDALVESAQIEIAAETERLYLELYEWEHPMSESAKQAIHDFAYKSAFFRVIRDKQEEIMNREYRAFIKVMQNEFEHQAKAAGMTVEEYEDFTLEIVTE